MQIRLAKNKQPNLKIFVGSLPGATTASEVRNYFSLFGEIEEVSMFYRAMNTLTGIRLNRGFCHVTAANNQTFEAILTQADHWFNGRLLRCTAYLKGEKLTEINKLNVETRVVLKDIPLIHWETKLKSYLELFGTVRYAYVIPRRSPRGFYFNPWTGHPSPIENALVQYHRRESAAALIAQGRIEIDGHTVTCERFVHKYQHRQDNLTPESGTNSGGSKPSKVKKSARGFTGLTREHHLKEQSTQGADMLKKSPSLFQCKMLSKEPQGQFHFHIKPTSSLFGKQAIHRNHEEQNNLLFKLVKKNAVETNRLQL